ncbi:hypothetical protein KUV89_16780 [Marinobacter hydrocarbonoclasticus]|nr:hypothetical protein [Marinobacter nauticus]
MKEFMGEDRRHVQRRQSTDRREALRWEPLKHDRRVGAGRRKEDRLKRYAL